MTGDHAARLRRLGSSIAPILAVLALSLAISWPLWTFATRDRRAFTACAGAAVALLLLFLAGRAARARLIRRGRAPKRAAAASRRA